MYSSFRSHHKVINQDKEKNHCKGPLLFSRICSLLADFKEFLFENIAVKLIFF